MKQFLRIASVVLILALAGLGFWYLRGRGATTGAASNNTYTQIVTVQRGDLSSSITVVGELAAVQSATLSFERMKGSTRLLTLTVQPGHVVAAGDVLATIDPTPYRQALDQARSDLQAAEEKLAKLRAPPTALDIARADQAVAKARYDLAQAQAALDALRAPDLSDLQRAVQNAQDNLALAKLQQTLTEHNSLARSERDLGYAVNWHQRRIAELQELIARGQANAEQVQELAREQEALGKSQADLARVRAERELALASAAAEVARAEAALADARAALVKAQGGGDALQLAKAELAVKEAELAVANAEEARAALDAGPDAVALAAAQAEVERKRLAVVEAEAALAGTELRVPFGGTVLRVYVAAGDLVTANTRVVTVADLSRLQVLAAVDETVIRRVAAGQGAVVTFDALPGQVLRGAVVSVPLQGTLQGGVTVYEVPVALEGAAGLPLLVGMTANVAIQTGEVKDALLVPTLALQRSGGRYQVRVPNTLDPGGMPEVVPVEVGLSDGVYTQVVRGLNEGDQVIVELSSSTNTTNPFRGFGEMLGGRAGGQVFRPSGSR